MRPPGLVLRGFFRFLPVGLLPFQLGEVGEGGLLVALGDPLLVLALGFAHASLVELGLFFLGDTVDGVCSLDHWSGYFNIGSGSWKQDRGGATGPGLLGEDVTL